MLKIMNGQKARLRRRKVARIPPVVLTSYDMNSPQLVCKDLVIIITEII